MQTQAQIRKARRTTKACVACRQSKIKCSGNEPCVNCQRRAIQCEFAERSSKIVVSERYLRHLEAQLQQAQGSSSAAKRSSTCPSESQAGPKDDYSPEVGGGLSDTARVLSSEPSPLETMSNAPCIWTSPFPSPSTTIKNTKQDKRSWIWLAPWSMWSFTTRLTILMSEELHHEYPQNAPTLIEREVYPLRWNLCSANDAPDITGLPSLDYALYLFDTVKFQLGQSFRFFDEKQFAKRLQEFYHGEPAKMASEYRLWFIQFLLVVAFGTALLCRSKSAQPPGSQFFVRAMSLMPYHAPMWKDSLLASEVLAMASLYLYSIDQRESAVLHLGQAIRIVQFEGLHTQLPEKQLGAETVARCRNLWWTLFIMDRHFSYSCGIPMTTQDSDISTLIDPPNVCSDRDITISLQAKLSHLLSFILTTVYRTEETQLNVFLDTTRSILQTLAGHAQEIEKIIHVRLRNSVDTMPRGTRHITLQYHQCVIIATRPLLLSALIKRLENLDHEKEDWQDFLSLTKTLICTGIKSAVKTLQILSNSDSLLEVFLPYDLEFTYAAAIHLAMANALFPQEADGPTHIKEAYSILDGLICNGNKVAEMRKEELVHLESLFQELATRAHSQGLQPLTLRTPENPEGKPPGNNIGEGDSSAREKQQEVEPTPENGLMDIPMPGYYDPSQSADMQMPSVEFLNSIGISSAEFLSIVDEIGHPDVLYDIPEA